MSNSHGIKNLFGQRALLAVSLTASIAAFGCTTDRHLGNGDPVVTPGLRTTPTSSPTSGSESGPMYSSYSQRSVDMSIRNGAPAASSAAGIATTLAELQPDVKVLGRTTADAVTPPGAWSASQVTGQFQNPALATNPRLTVNSSVTSQPVPAISSGAGGGAAGTGGVSVGGSFVGDALTVGGTGSAVSVGGNVTNPAAPLVAPAPALSPTAASIDLPAAAFTTRTLSPTAASVVTAPASVSATRATSTLAASRMNAARRASNVTPGQTVTNATPVTTATTSLTRSASVSSGAVRIVTDANGRAVLTNDSND